MNPICWQQTNSESLFNCFLGGQRMTKYIVLFRVWQDWSHRGLWLGDLVFSTTFNNISVILWWSVKLMEETGVPGENHDLPQVTDKLYDIMLYRVHFVWAWENRVQHEYNFLTADKIWEFFRWIRNDKIYWRDFV